MKLIFLAAFVSCLWLHTEAASCDLYWSEVASRPVRTDVCHQPFSRFLDCLTGKIEAGIDTIIAEADKDAQREAQQCFQNKGCAASYEGEAALDAFLPCTYQGDTARKQNCIFRYTADKLIALFDDTPKPVGKCIIRYFKGLGQRKINDCVVDYPPPGGLQEPYSQPPIPGFEDFDLEELKNVLIYHVMTRYHLKKCTDCKASSKPGLIPCLASQVQDQQEDVCESRQQCEGFVRNAGSCAGRYEKVRGSICRCAAGEFKKGLKALDDWKELKNAFLRGDLECQLEECYADAGESNMWSRPGGMAARYKDVKLSAIRAATQLLTASPSNPAPKGVAEALVVFKSIIEELVDKWSGIFCGDCSQTRESPQALRALSYRELLSDPACEDPSKAFDLSNADTFTAQLSQVDEDRFDDFFG